MMGSPTQLIVEPERDPCRGSLNEPAGGLAGTTWRQPQAVRPEVVMPWFKLQ